MSARDDLLAALRWRDHPVGDPAQHEAELDAYRAEVLRESGGVADELIAAVDRTDPDAFAKVDAYRAYSDRLHEIADGAPPPAGWAASPADFFQAGRTYQRHPWVFQCLAVAPHPFNGETRAVGCLYRPGEPATATALDPDDWAHGGWTYADSADRFPYLGTAPRAAVAYRSPTSGRLYCRQCCTRLGVWANLTSEDLPDGGICARCGIDVLIDPPQSEAGEAR